MTHGHAAFSRDGRFFQRGSERVSLRGITYGPFSSALGTHDHCLRDLDAIVGLGFNAIRVYERPSSPFLRCCGERGLAVFVSLKWASNTDFVSREDEILEALAADVVALRGESAVAGYFIGNEVPSTLVRWIGGVRVRRFLEKAFDRLHQLDPARLYSYANYPSTEYLQPRNGDFVSFNIYLEEREAVRRYVRRLHHLADDRPLVISEYGLDSVRNGEARQAETLAWLTEEVFGGGVAGAFLFSYTDDWFNGGRQMTDWGFGLVANDRTPKLSAARMKATLTECSAPHLPAATPLVSAIVCSHNGHGFLPACLEHLSRSLHTNVEVLVIDDGSNPGIDAIVDQFPGMRYVRQEHTGLSVARNRGAQEASGEILAFTDDDCEPDQAWLSELVAEMQRQGVDACGGPNIAPPATTVMEAAIQRAPGNPTHVMLDDFRAEHLPGCNLAVRAEAFHAIGGFREHYRVAGDDVDFCWRLQFEERRLGFAPNAVVWHHRRKTWQTFMIQQLGYGRAEALLHWDHPQKYGGLGGTDWKGTVYMPLATRTLSRPVIYFGQDGTAPFQSIYHGRPGAETLLVGLMTSFPWLAAIGITFMLGFGLPSVWWLSVLLLVMSLGASAWAARSVSLPEAGNAWTALAVNSWLRWSTSIARQLMRWWHAGPRRWHRAWWEERCAFWNRKAKGREDLLAALRTDLTQGGHPQGPALPNQWSAFDLILPPTSFAHLTVATVTEHHESEECLTRVAVKAYLKRSTTAVIVLSAAWLVGQVLGGNLWWSLPGVVVLGGACAALHWHTQRSVNAWLENLKRLAKDLELQEMPS